MKEREGSLIVLNRSVVIGIIVLVTTISFTFGYFVGRYSAPKIGPSENRQEISGPQSGLQSTVTSPPQAEEKQLAAEEKEEKSPSSPVSEKPASQTAQPVKKEQPQSSQSQKEVSFKKDAYYLQVGAFKEESRAIKLRDNLKKETTVSPSFDVIIKKDGSSVYRVYVGAFKTRKEALLAQTRIRKLYGIDSIIIKK
ncbi:MAG: SPOR domain-containing protein [Thermodesulfovibrionales bacterium]